MEAGRVRPSSRALPLRSPRCIAFVRYETSNARPDDGPHPLPRPRVCARDRDRVRRALHVLRDAAPDHAVPAERARIHTRATPASSCCRSAWRCSSARRSPDRWSASYGTAVPIRFGLVIMMVALVVLMAGTARHPVLVTSGLAAAGFGFALCITPITSLAMTSVAARARGHGVGHHERATRDRLDARFRGHGIDPVGVAWRDARPRSRNGREGSGGACARSRRRSSPAPIRARTSRRSRPRVRCEWRADVRDVAEADFVTGIRISLFVGDRAARDRVRRGLAWFPRGRGATHPRRAARSGCGERSLACAPDRTPTPAARTSDGAARRRRST